MNGEERPLHMQSQFFGYLSTLLVNGNVQHLKPLIIASLTAQGEVAAEQHGSWHAEQLSHLPMQACVPMSGLPDSCTPQAWANQCGTLPRS